MTWTGAQYRFVIGILILILVGCSKPPESETTAATSDTAPTLEHYLAELVKHDKMMSAVLVTRNGEPQFEYYQGLASIEQKVPITADTRFRVGSITKTFTAVLIMQLVESEQLHLDTTLEKFFPAVPNAERITIKQLLNHRSGIHSFTDEQVYLTYMTKPQTRAEMLERVQAYEPVFEPGTEHRYSNSNYVLLGYIIEDLYQQPYAQVLQDKIAQPLGLMSTGFGDAIDIADNEASSYRFSRAWQPAPETHMSVPHAAGAVVSTARDINAFLVGLFNGKLVAESSLNRMMELQDGYGLGMFAMPFYASRLYGHNGSIDGFIASAAYNPEDGIAMTVLSNAVNMTFNDALIAVLSAVYGKPIEIPDFSRKPISLENDAKEKTLGVYASDNLPMDIELRLEGDQLMAQATGQSALPLTPFSATEFRFEPAGIVMEFDPASIEGERYTRFTLKQSGAQYVFQRKLD